MTTQHWPTELRSFLQVATRECRFDWNAITLAVTRFHESTNSDLNLNITPASCREQFALADPVVDAAVEVGSKKPTPTPSAEANDVEENLSVEEMIARMDEKDREMQHRKEQVFRKVLSSLGGENADSLENLGADFYNTKQIYQERQQAKEVERLRKQALAEEQIEKKRLEAEREQLRMRFDMHSKDNVGEDPLSELSLSAASVAKNQGDDASIIGASDPSSEYENYLDNSGYDPTVAAALENFMESDEFDIMLTEIEKDIEAHTAPGKNEDEPSEMTEILKILELSAAQQKSKQPSAVQPSPALSADRKQTEKTTAEKYEKRGPEGEKVVPPAQSRPSQTGGGGYGGRGSGGRGGVANSSSTASRITTTVSPAAAPVALTSSSNSNNSQGGGRGGGGMRSASHGASSSTSRGGGRRGGGYGGRGGGGGRGSGNSSAEYSSAALESKEDPGSDEDEEGEQGEEDADSDLEINWRSTRHRMKQSGATAAAALNQDDDRPAGKSGNRQVNYRYPPSDDDEAEDVKNTAARETALQRLASGGAAPTRAPAKNDIVEGEAEEDPRFNRFLQDLVDAQREIDRAKKAAEEESGSSDDDNDDDEAQHDEGKRADKKTLSLGEPKRPSAVPSHTVVAPVIETSPVSVTPPQAEQQASAENSEDGDNDSSPLPSVSWLPPPPLSKPLTDLPALPPVVPLALLSSSSSAAPVSSLGSRTGSGVSAVSTSGSLGGGRTRGKALLTTPSAVDETVSTTLPPTVTTTPLVAPTAAVTPLAAPSVPLTTGSMGARRGDKRGGGASGPIMTASRSSATTRSTPSSSLTSAAAVDQASAQSTESNIPSAAEVQAAIDSVVETAKAEQQAASQEATNADAAAEVEAPRAVVYSKKPEHVVRLHAAQAAPPVYPLPFRYITDRSRGSSVELFPSSPLEKEGGSIGGGALPSYNESADIGIERLVLVDVKIDALLNLVDPAAAQQTTTGNTAHRVGGTAATAAVGSDLLWMAVVMWVVDQATTSSGLSAKAEKVNNRFMTGPRNDYRVLGLQVARDDVSGVTGSSSDGSTTSGCGPRLCRIVLETLHSNATQSELSNAADALTLRELLHQHVTSHISNKDGEKDDDKSGAAMEQDLRRWLASSSFLTQWGDLPLSTFLKIRDFFSVSRPEEIERDIQNWFDFTQPQSSTASSVLYNHFDASPRKTSADDDSSAVFGANGDFASLALKDHIFQHYTPPQSSSSAAVGGAGAVIKPSRIVLDLLTRTEREGLRLCGCRLVFLNALTLFEVEKYCSVPGYTRPALPRAQILQQAASNGLSRQHEDHHHAADSAVDSDLYNTHLLPVFCLAFQRLSVSTHVPEPVVVPTSTTSSTTSVTTSSGVSPFFGHHASKALRGMLGPEDPALALRTDPTSLRARYGGVLVGGGGGESTAAALSTSLATVNKHWNVGYAVPNYGDRLHKELCFWFGSRKVASHTTSTVSSCPAVSALPHRQLFLLPAPRLIKYTIELNCWLQLHQEGTATRCSVSSKVAQAQLRALQTSVLHTLHTSILYTSRESRAAIAAAVGGGGSAAAVAPLASASSTDSGTTQLLSLHVFRRDCSTHKKDGSLVEAEEEGHNAVQQIHLTLRTFAPDLHLNHWTHLLQSGCGEALRRRGGGGGKDARLAKEENMESFCSTNWSLYEEPSQVMPAAAAPTAALALAVGAIAAAAPAPAGSQLQALELTRQFERLAASTSELSSLAADDDYFEDERSVKGKGGEVVSRYQETDHLHYYKSHEDVGLSDCVVLTLGGGGAAGSPVFTPSELLLSLHLLLHSLPRTCEATLVALRCEPGLESPCSSTTPAAAATIITGEVPTTPMVARPKLSCAVHGYQLLENLEYRLNELRNKANKDAADTASGKNGSSSIAIKKDAPAAAVQSLASPSPSSSVYQTLQYVKGKRAMEFLFSHFDYRREIYHDVALQDMLRYVPSYAHDVIGSSSGVDIPSPSSPSSFTVAKSLFPPGCFMSLAVIMIPWISEATHPPAAASSSSSSNATPSKSSLAAAAANHSHAMSRNLSRVLSRLEKDHFEVLEMKTVVQLRGDNNNDHFNAVAELFEDLCRENEAEFEYGRAHIDPASPSRRPASVCVQECVVLLVRHRRGALLRLKSLLGPSLSADLARRHYPRSLTALLHSLHESSAAAAALSAGTSGGRGLSAEEADELSLPCQLLPVPYLLPTLTCASLQSALTVLFPHFAGKTEVQLNCYGLNGLHHHHLNKAGGSSASGTVSALQGMNTAGDDALRVPLVPRLNSTIPPAVPGSAALLLQKATTTTSTSSSLASQQRDIAAIVLTHELLQEVGIGAIVDTLHQENIVIRNAYTTHLNLHAARNLTALAGASSLSMKPPLHVLMDGPVLVLGIEGPSHSFVRFKSMGSTGSVVGTNTGGIWKLQPSITSGLAAGAGKGTAVAVDERWGVLASSSARLGKDLYSHCFDHICGAADSQFEFDVAPSTGIV